LPSRPLSHHLIAAFVVAHVVVVVATALGGPPNLRDPDSPGEYYGRYLGVTQRWFMFNRVTAGTTRVEIAIRVDGAWRDVYVERSPDLDWNARAFDHYRWREYMNNLRITKRRAAWDRFIPWVADRVFGDFPEADAVRVRTMRGKVPSPKVLARQGGVRYREERKSTVVERSDRAPP